MSFRIKQKIKGRYYIYEVTSTWDKEKKRPVQKRKYLGTEDNVYPKNKNFDYSKLTSKNYGNIALLDHVANESGLRDMLKKYFPKYFEKILILAYYEISEANSSDYFNYWVEEQAFFNTSILNQTSNSDFYKELGFAKEKRFEFNKTWIEHIKPFSSVYYNLTSVSSYSNDIDFIEWGFNNFKENLFQISIGLFLCKKTSLPLYYELFQDSIVDISTIKNLILNLNFIDFKQIKLVMDNGFCSKLNIDELNNQDEKFEFLQPLSFSLEEAKNLIIKHKVKLKSEKTKFKFKDEIVHYFKSKITIDYREFDAHIFYNENIESKHRVAFVNKLMDIQSKFNSINFETIQEFENAIKDNISEKFRKYFFWNEKSKKLERDKEKIEIHLNNEGYLIIIGNKLNADKYEILDYYQNKDKIEKIFNVHKNKMNSNQLSNYLDNNTKGILFVKFIALIIYIKISKTMQKNKILKTITTKELLLELQKIKKYIAIDNSYVISDITENQREILDLFKLKLN